MGMRITEVLEAKVKITVQKTRKSYYRTMNYAKHIIKGEVGGAKTHEYFLRDGRSWRQVSEAEFKEATSKEAVKKIHEQLSADLKHRVEQEQARSRKAMKCE